MSFVIGKEEKETKRLSVLLKKFDELSPFGKELIFSFLMGYGEVTASYSRFKTVLDEMENIKS
jgi:hypothetical protein